jgi:hypothetical protein
VTLANDTYDGCTPCHGSFTGSTSPKGTQFPSGNKHTMHRNSANMGTACNLCHYGSNYTPVYLGRSNGTTNNPGVGCNGCHGEDYGGSLGFLGAGLRRHHYRKGVTSCRGCHVTDPIPLPEKTKPRYYGTVDTKCDDSCNKDPNYLENWSIGDQLGLDNDGDGQYDAARDLDCAGKLGDMNCDGSVNFADINPFVICLSDPNVYEQGSQGCSAWYADCNGDGQINFADINAFVALIGTD